MIQPLKAPKNNWFLYWVDLVEPVPGGADWILPTVVLLCDQSGTPIAPPEILEELDQAKIESFLYKAFDAVGQPDRLSIPTSDEWDVDAWQAFSADCKLDLRFLSAERGVSDELRALTKTLVMRVAREPDGPSHARDVAAGLVRAAMRTKSPAKRSELLKAAISRDPECSAARIELADLEFDAGNWKSCLTAYDEVVAREAVKWSSGGADWWTDAETRPYLRAVYGRAMTQWHLGRFSAAARTLDDLLTMNPRDHQGARFLVPMLHLLAESPERAAEAFRRYAQNYPGDYLEPSFLFGWALSFSLEGLEGEARAKYQEGCLKNVYIAPMLLEQEEPKRGLWAPTDRCEPSYASDFIESYAVLWDREPGALRLLREVYADMLPRIERLVAHRQFMTDFQDQRYEPEYKQRWQELVAEDERLSQP